MSDNSSGDVVTLYLRFVRNIINELTLPAGFFFHHLFIVLLRIVRVSQGCVRILRLHKCSVTRNLSMIVENVYKILLAYIIYKVRCIL